MAETEGLRARYGSVSALHARGIWRHGPVRATNLRLTSWRDPSEISVETVERFVEYAEHLGVHLELQGGGAGCFDLVFGSEDDGGKALERAILGDEHFQVLLAEMNVNLARVRLGGGYRAYACHARFNGAIITNRRQRAGITGGEPLRLFGNETADELRFAIAEFHALDFAATPGSAINRVWKAITLNLGDVRTRRQSYELVRLDLVDAETLKRLLGELTASSFLVCVHGYANDFTSAAGSFAEFIAKTHVYARGYFPILFSWPSPGEPMLYLRDTDEAAISQDSLAEALELVCKGAGDRPVSVMAHSHGNKILVEVGRDRANRGSAPQLRRMILVEPDVEARYMSSRLGLLCKAAQGLTFYHSSNDRALKLAQLLFGNPRAGQIGVSVAADTLIHADIEVIDASGVAEGLTRHSPHVDAIKVIYDIRDALEGASPIRRGLSARPDPKCWAIG